MNDKIVQIIKQNEYWSVAAYFCDVPVGAVCCRFEDDTTNNTTTHKLYIMTLGVLAPYRQLGIGMYIC